MKKSKLILFLIFLIYVSIGYTQEVEPNNFTSQANIVEIDSTISGSIDANDGFDWFLLNVDTAATLAFDITKTGDAQILIQLRDGINSNWSVAGTQLFNIDSTGTFEAHVLRGSYYLMLDHSGG